MREADRPGPPARRVLRFLPVALVLAVLLATSSLAEQPAQPPPASRRIPTVSKETTLLLGPLNADGTVNYVAAVNELLGRGVTAANNAAIPLIWALGPETLDQETRNEVLRRLGIAPVPREMWYVPPYVYFAAEQPDANSEDGDRWVREVWDAPERGPVSSADPLVARWLERNAKPLSLAIEGSKRSHYVIPLVSNRRPPRMQDVLKSHCTMYVDALVRTLASRAMLEAGSGRFDAALADLQAARRLALLIASWRFLVDQVMAASGDDRTLACFASLGAWDKLNARQARQLLQALDAGAMPATFGTHPHQVELLFGLDYLTAIGREGLDAAVWPVTVSEDDVRIPDADIDIDLILRLEQEAWAAFTKANSLPTYAQRSQARRKMDETEDPDVAAIYKEYPGFFAIRRRVRALIERLRSATRKQRTAALHDLLSRPMSIKVEKMAARYEAHRFRYEITRLACALAVFRRETGRYPARLEELAPKYVAAVPNDLFSNRPLIYRPSPKGFLLYSVGPNQRDDSGKDDAIPERDDIAARAPL